MLCCNTNILCIGGLDPSGAAGLLADARMLQHLGGRSVALMTSNTVQSRRQHCSSFAVPLEILRQQWRTLRRDLPIHGVKIGAVANSQQADWLAQLVPTLGVPVVFDPVLSSSAGGALGQTQAARQLMRIADLSTPNGAEVLALYGEDWAVQLPQPCLVTGTDDSPASPGQPITHTLHDPGHPPRQWRVERRSGHYRGSGCLLASALCAALVSGLPLTAACNRALQEVDIFLQQAWRFPDGVHLPQAPA